MTKFITHNVKVAAKAATSLAPNCAQSKTAKLPRATKPASGGKGMLVCSKKSAEIPA